MPAALSSSTKARANAGSPFRSYGVPGIKSGASSATQTPRWGSCTVAYQLNVETQCAELTTNRSGRRPRSARPICFRPSISPLWKAGTRSSMPSRGACGATATAMRPPGMFSSCPLNFRPARGEWVGSGGSGPNLAGRLGHEAQFGELVVRRERVPLLGGGKAALGAQRQPLQRDITCGLPDAPRQHLLALQEGLLGRHKTENNHTVFGHVLQRLKAAGAFVIVLQEETLKMRSPQNVG